MDWPIVWQMIVTAVGLGGVIVGLLLAMGRILRPWMDKAARDAVDGLERKLDTNHFRSIDKRFDQAHEDRRAMEARLSKVDTRLEQMDTHLEQMDTRLNQMAASNESHFRELTRLIVEKVIS